MRRRFSRKTGKNAFSKLFEIWLDSVNHSLARRHLRTGCPRMAIFSHDHIGLTINSQGIYERELLDFLFEWLTPWRNEMRHTMALDIGANIGNHTRYFARYFARVIAFEPNPNAFELLQINCRQEKRIECRNVGLSSLTRPATLVEPVANLGGSNLANREEAIPIGAETTHDITLRRLDDEGEGLERVFLIKIDVEGHECDILKGGLALIKTHRPLIVLEVQIGRPEAWQFLKSLGYDFFIVRRNFDFTQPPLRHFGILLRLILGERNVIERVDTIPNRFFHLVIAVPPDSTNFFEDSNL